MVKFSQDANGNLDMDPDGSTLTVDQTNDRVGIGTMTPSTLLEVAGDTLVTGQLSIGSALILQGSTVTATADELNLLTGAGLTANQFLVADPGGTTFTTTSVLQFDAINQRIGIGTSSPQVKLDMVSSTANETQFRMEQANDTADAPDVRTYKARGTVASKIAVADDDYLFGINSFAYNGSSYVNAGSLLFRADGTAGDGYFTLSTTQGGTSSIRLATTDTGAIRISDAFTLPTSDGSASQVLQTDGSGTVSWATVSGGGGTPGGNPGEIQFNSAGSFGGDSNLFWDDTNDRLGVGTNAPSHTLHVRNLTAVATVPLARFQSDEGNILFNRYGGIMIQNNEPSGSEPVENNRWQIQQRDGDNTDPPDGPFDISYGDGSGGFVGASATIIRATSGGNVGIGLGSTDPSTRLHVNGTIRQTNSTSAVLVSDANGDIGSASNLQDVAYLQTVATDGTTITGDGAGTPLATTGLTETCMVRLDTSIVNIPATPGGYALVQSNVLPTGPIWDASPPNPNFDANTGLYTVATAGVYRISWAVAFRYTNSGQTQASRIYVNGSPAAQGTASTTGNWPVPGGSILLTLNPGDTVALYYYQSQSGTNLVGDTTSVGAVYMSINKVSV